MTTYLLVGLGNPGPDYAMTRHNIGFMIMDRLRAGLVAPDWQLSRQAFWTEGTWKGRRVVLLKPTTYMNLSGLAVRHWMGQEKVTADRLLVATDDLALPFGKLRMRAKGSGGGHNGLGNIEQILATTEYPRLRFGIGDTFSKGRQVDYVLNPFADKEQAELPERIEAAAKAMLDFVFLGLERAMNGVN